MVYLDVKSAQALGVGRDLGFETIFVRLHVKQAQRYNRGGGCHKVEQPLKNFEGSRRPWFEGTSVLEGNEVVLQGSDGCAVWAFKATPS